MKTASDPRHKLRRKIIKFLFSESFIPQEKKPSYVKNILEKTKTIDASIKKAAPAWPIEKINKIDLAILRLAVFELKYTSVPPKVIIDEAIELSKEFGSESSPSFVNGVLGAIYSGKTKNG